mmetsp:Transcript_33092/g.82293  ORF Transcript_33092/g.82293 Transcript_33092/m.82293 type:complete len:414 (+) Transcript_33092:23-1264(+)
MIVHSPRTRPYSVITWNCQLVVRNLVQTEPEIMYSQSVDNSSGSHRRAAQVRRSLDSARRAISAALDGRLLPPRRFELARVVVARLHGGVHREEEVRVLEPPLAARLGVREQRQPAQRAARPAAGALREHVEHKREAEGRARMLSRQPRLAIDLHPVQAHALQLRRQPLNRGQVEPPGRHEWREHVEVARRPELVEHLRARQLGHAGGQDAVPGLDLGQSDVEREIGAVGERRVKRRGDVGGGEDEHVRVGLERVELRQHGVHHANRVGGLGAVKRCGARGRERLHLVDEDGHEALRVIQQLTHLCKDRADELARLAEPLGEERVRVQLDQLPLRELLRRAREQLVRERAAERCLPRAGRAVQQQQPVARDEVAVDTCGGEGERRARVREQLVLHRRLEEQRLPMAVERGGRQ